MLTSLVEDTVKVFCPSRQDARTICNKSRTIARIDWDTACIPGAVHCLQTVVECFQIMSDHSVCVCDIITHTYTVTQVMTNRKHCRCRRSRRRQYNSSCLLTASMCSNCPCRIIMNTHEQQCSCRLVACKFRTRRVDASKKSARDLERDDARQRASV